MFGVWCLVFGVWCGTSAFPEGAFAEGGDPSERVPERWRIDAGGCIPPAASVKLIAEYDSRTPAQAYGELCLLQRQDQGCPGCREDAGGCPGGAEEDDREF